MPPTPRILIVCEDPATAAAAVQALQNAGLGILGVLNNGQDALAKTAAMVPDLVIMDVKIAGTMDAIDTGHYIFQIFHIPVLFIAGVNDTEKLGRVTYAQPYGIVFRPFAAIQIITLANLAIATHTDRLPSLGPLPLGDSRRMMTLTEEGIIILDKRARLLLFNTFASWFVDMLPEKAFLRHWRDVMMFISDASNEEVSDPVTAAARQRAGAIYDSAVSLVTTTSKRRKVILGVRPILDTRDRQIGSIMSLKENKKTYM